MEYDPERKVLNVCCFLKNVTCAHGPLAISGPGIYCRQDDGLTRPSYCIAWLSGHGCCRYTRSQVACHRYANRRREHQPVSLSAFQLALRIMIFVLQLFSLTFAGACYCCSPWAKNAQDGWKTKRRSKPREASRMRYSAGKGKIWIDHSSSPGFFVLIMFDHWWRAFRIRTFDEANGNIFICGEGCTRSTFCALVCPFMRQREAWGKEDLITTRRHPGGSGNEI